MVGAFCVKCNKFDDVVDRCHCRYPYLIFDYPNKIQTCKKCHHAEKSHIPDEDDEGFIFRKSCIVTDCKCKDYVPGMCFIDGSVYVEEN